ncbi:ATP-binding protein [Faecalibacterium sp. An122]|uniref:ATP-binding protein n=1 Tax=Faecalibacterium sp. An122 TaxID=1965551 RepID=UPI000B3921BC|nr:ATP-binding protein [Faecalibacterium sp. An122]OUQ38663.1 ATPase [Faecalibacterium sp. An122]
MNIKRAKDEIKRSVRAYLAKDALGEYAIPAIRQRPILLMGPPGIGKTQILEQAARECGVALVAYTITHHTRQSAVGLPFIRQKHYGDRDVSVTEYTMSEIISSIYEKMETTGLKEGILFIDEINCVSETLAPTMLQFLQCKTFGNQAVPAGWVIVAAGNPPEYNKSVRDFDIVTLDRVRRMDIEPDLPAWRDYARAVGIHGAILSYLELHPQNFYQINADVEGTQFVTARGWEDLSNLLDTYESLDLQADEEVIRQYLQHKQIAEDFASYLDLYYKYRDDYGVEEILAGKPRSTAFARLLQAPFDERLSLVSLMLAGLKSRFAASCRRNQVTDDCYALLRQLKQDLALLPDAESSDPERMLQQQISDYEAETARLRTANALDKEALAHRLGVAAALREWAGKLRRANAAGTKEALDLLRSYFEELADEREKIQEEASAALEAAFDFMEQAFGESQEMVIFVTELTVSPAAHTFITENGCDRYFRYNKDLLLDSRKAALDHELAAEELRNPLRG